MKQQGHPYIYNVICFSFDDTEYQTPATEIYLLITNIV